MTETLARAIIFAVMCGVLVAFVWIIKRMWRAIRGVKAEDVARTAGALTTAAQSRAADIGRAFKDGRGR